MRKEKAIELINKMLEKLDDDMVIYIYFRILAIYRRRNLK